MSKEKDLGLLIVISGPSEVGKGTIVQRIINEIDNIKLSISMTSREKRENELDGIHYYFISKEEFEKKVKNNEFLEYAIVHNNQYYGTPKSKIEEDIKRGISIILEIDTNGALNIKKIYKNALLIFIMPPDMNVLKERLINRNTEDITNINERLNTAHKEIEMSKYYDYIVVNDDINTATNEVKNIILKEKDALKKDNKKNNY